MATDVDLQNTTVFNSFLPNKIEPENSSDTTFNGLLENTSDISTQAESGGFGTKEEQWGWLATIVLLLVILLVNGAVLGVTWKATRLHSSLYGLMASLAVAHAVNALLVMPMAINAAIYGKSSNARFAKRYNHKFYYHKILFSVLF